MKPTARPLVIGFFTQDSPYAEDARLLRASLDRAGTRHAIAAVHDRGSWDRNTAHKANFLRSQRGLFPGPLLYVDVDAFVHHDPTVWLAENVAPEVDFAAHWFAGPSRGWNHNDVCPCVHGGECDREHRFLSGTLYLGDTDGCRALLDAWCERNERKREQGDGSGGGQRNLWETLDAMGDDLTTMRLPGRFAYVFDKPWGYPETEPCWIEHTIASRENRPRSDMTDRGFWRRKNHARRKRIAELRRLVGTTETVA